MTFEQLELMGFGICSLTPADYYSITLNELLIMTQAKINYELWKQKKYRPKRSKENLQSDYEWLKKYIGDENEKTDNKITS